MSEQRTLSLGFREFQLSHYERLVEIYNANYPHYRISVAERRSRDESVDRTKYLLRRFECVEQERDKIVGFGELLNVPDMYHPRKFMASVLVDPEQQCSSAEGLDEQSTIISKRNLLNDMRYSLGQWLRRIFPNE